MPALVAGIHVLAASQRDVDGRDKPGHDREKTMAAGYKLVTYASPKGPRAGLVVGERVHDAADLTGNATDTTVLTILEDWSTASARLKAAIAKATGGIALAEAK